jgi:hypothetical protein
VGGGATFGTPARQRSVRALRNKSAFLVADHYHASARQPPGATKRCVRVRERTAHSPAQGMSGKVTSKLSRNLLPVTGSTSMCSTFSCGCSSSGGGAQIRWQGYPPAPAATMGDHTQRRTKKSLPRSLEYGSLRPRSHTVVQYACSSAQNSAAASSSATIETANGVRKRTGAPACRVSGLSSRPGPAQKPSQRGEQTRASLIDIEQCLLRTRSPAEGQGTASTLHMPPRAARPPGTGGSQRPAAWTSAADAHQRRQF